MPVKIRLARRGRRKSPYYHIIVADARSPRDGKFIDNIGSYNPMTKPATIELDREKAYDWIMKGAQPTHTARAILKFKGVFYKKHLMRGVAKGSLTEEKALEMYNAWIDSKEAKIAERVEETRKEKELFWKMVSGEIKAPKAKVQEDAASDFREDTADAADTNDAPAETTEAVAEAPAAEPAKLEEAVAEAPVAEPAKVEEVVAEAPAKAEAAVEEVAAKVEEKVAEEAAPAVAAVAAVAAAAEEVKEVVSEEAPEAAAGEEE